MRAREFTTEAVLDPGGWGETPYGTDIDYFGLRVQMKPSTFLKLALPLGSAETNPEVEKHMRAGGKIAYPMLDIEIPDGWEKNDFSEPAKVVSHEGRNRMKTWIDLKGDDPIQVNIRPRGWYRRSHLSPEHLESISKGLISQRGNFVSGPLFPVDTALEEDMVDEAEKRTAASMEIRSNMRDAGYKLLGSGADATVWAKKEGPVIKIIMPDDGQGAGTAGDTFMRFYDFCKEHEGYDNLPRFSDNEVEAFEADGKQYIMVTMERLVPIARHSFQEAMVWILSELATRRISWDEALRTISNERTWDNYGEMDTLEILRTLDSLDDRDLLEYEVLFKLMTLLYHRGRINKIGWDLHTENAMMRGDTIVITDPWFNMETK